MDAEKTNSMVAGLSRRKVGIQDQINRKRELIVKEQQDIAKLEEQIQDIELDIAKIKMRAQKEAGREEPQEPIDVEESDAATTTGALDGVSQSSGGPSGGDFGGWKHYSKVGEVQTRRKLKKKPKKKKIDKFMDSYFDESVEGEK